MEKDDGWKDIEDGKNRLAHFHFWLNLTLDCLGLLRTGETPQSVGKRIIMATMTADGRYTTSAFAGMIVGIGMFVIDNNSSRKESK